MGVRAEENHGNDPRQKPGSSWRSLRKVPVLDSGARGSDDHVCRARHRRTCCWPGRTEASWQLKESDRRKSTSSCVDQHLPKPRCAGRQGCDKHGTARWRKLPRVLLQRRGGPGHCRAQFTATERMVAAKYADQFRDQHFGIDEVFALGQKAPVKEPISPTGGVFDQIYQKGNGKDGLRRGHDSEVIVGGDYVESLKREIAPRECRRGSNWSWRNKSGFARRPVAGQRAADRGVCGLRQSKLARASSGTPASGAALLFCRPFGQRTAPEPGRPWRPRRGIC